jgi:CRP-like cAMP-binding protein
VAWLRWRPGRRVLTEIALARALCVTGSAILAATGAPFAPLLVLLGLDALVSALYRPAQSALIPSLARTPKELVASATGLSTVKTISQGVGAVIGGALLAATTPEWVFGGAAVVFLGGALATAPFRQGVTSEPLVPVSRGLVGLTRDTLKVVRYPHIGGIVVVSGLRTFVRGMWIAIAVIASLRLLHAGSAGVGLLMLAAGIGSLVAAPLSSMLVKRSRLGTPAALALAACGMPLALIAGVPVFSVALALVVAWGIGMAVSDVATTSLLQRLVETPLAPRVTGTIESTKLALEGLGGFLAPVLVSTFGVRPALLIAAFPLPAVVVGGWRTLHHVDATASQRAARLALLHGVYCLQPLDLPSLDGLVARLSSTYIPEGGVEVIRQGDRGDLFYVVESGNAEILVDGFVVGFVQPGDSFGERALLRDVARTATVRSCGPMQLLVLSRQDFVTALTGQDERLTGPRSAAVAGDGQWTRRQLVEVLSHLSLLSHLEAGALGALADRCVLARWEEGTTMVRQGDQGDRFFVLLEGRARVCVDAKPVGELRAGDQFGEIALLHDVPRSADVVALSPAVALSLHRDDFLPAVSSRLLQG